MICGSIEYLIISNTLLITSKEQFIIQILKEMEIFLLIKMKFIIIFNYFILY